jgi:RimJ/RimL family protein N-acetyltransferase
MLAGLGRVTMDASRYAADVVIRDGHCVHLRAIRPDDRQALLDGFNHLTGQSVYFRFLGARQVLTEAELRYFTELDFERHVAIAAIIGEGEAEKPIGVARYIQTADPAGGVAELAITIADDYQPHGVGTVLFEQLVCIARRKGIARLTAEVLPCNQVMLDIFRHSGPDPDMQRVNGITRVEMDIAGREPVMHYEVQTKNG